MRMSFVRWFVGGAVALVLTLVLVVVVAYLVLRNMDLDSYRPRIQAEVKALTGRDLTIGGPLQVAFDGGLVIRADTLALSNAAWGTRPEMLKLGSAAATVALWPLLSGELRARRIDLHDLDLLLETDASGKGNWELGTPNDDSAGSGIPDIRAVNVVSGQIAWHRIGQPTQTLQIESLLLQPDAGRLGLRADGVLAGQAFKLAGSSSWLRAWNEPQPWSFDVTLHVLGADFAAKGVIREEPWGRSPAASFSAKKVDLAVLGELVGVAVPQLPPLDLSFELSRDAKVWRLGGLQAKVGASDVTGEVQLAAADKRPILSGQLTARRLDLTELVSRTDATPAKAQAPLFGDAVLPLAALRGWDGELRLRVDRIDGLGPKVRDLQIDTQLRDAELTLSPLRAALGQGGTVEGRAALAAAGDNPSWTLQLQAKRIPAALLLGSAGASLIDAPADMTLDLRTRGASPALMADNLSGKASLLVDSGRARMKAIDTMVGGLSTLTGQLLEKGQDDAKLNCAIANFSVRGGVADANVLLIDSVAATVRGDGRVDLGRERIDLTFTPRPKKPTVNVAVPVHVRGPLRQPDFTPDRMESFKKLVGVVGLFVYPPAALATLGDLGAADNACVRMMHGGAEQPASESTMERIQHGVGGAAESLGSGLKKLFGD